MLSQSNGVLTKTGLSPGLFTIGWTLQLGVGTGLFVVSGLFQFLVLANFLSHTTVALVVAVALAIGKVISIVWHRYLSIQLSIYPPRSRLASSSFRLALIVFSFLTTTVYLVGSLDRPHLQTVRQQHLQQLEQQFLKNQSELREQHKTALRELDQQQRNDSAEKLGSYDRHIAQLIADLKLEINDHSTTPVLGTRYLELNKRLQREQTYRDQLAGTIAEQHRRQREILVQTLNETLQQLNQNHADKNHQIDKDEFLNDYQVNNSLINALLTVIEHTIGWHLPALTIVLFFSLLLALVMELGIFIAFETITLAMLPAIAMQHEQRIRVATMSAKLGSEMELDRVRHSVKVKRANTATNSIIERARLAVRAAQNSG